MCDYIGTEQGRVFGIDPGLRVAASTLAAMFQAWVRSGGGKECFVNSETVVKFRPGFGSDQLRALLGDFADPAMIVNRGIGTNPFSWLHEQGWGRLLIMAPSERVFPAVLSHPQRLIPVHDRMTHPPHDDHPRLLPECVKGRRRIITDPAPPSATQAGASGETRSEVGPSRPRLIEVMNRPEVREEMIAGAVTRGNTGRLTPRNHSPGRAHRHLREEWH